MDANSVMSNMVTASIDLTDKQIAKGIRDLNNPDFLITGIVAFEGQLYFTTDRKPIKKKVSK